MARGLRNGVKTLVGFAHRQINRSLLLSAWYLQCWVLILRALPDRPLKREIVGNLEQFPWRLDRLPPKTYRFPGGASCRVVPHPGLLDFQGVFFREPVYEREVFRFLGSELGNVDTVIEIGANVGVFSLFFAKQLRDRGKIYSFEPSPRVHEALLENLRASAVRNVTTLNAAVFDRAGIARFYEPVVAAYGFRDLARNSLFAQHASWKAEQVREYDVFTVNAAHLAPLFGGAGRLLVKMDVEGAEHRVLAELKDLILEHQPRIVMEVLHVDRDKLNQLDFLLQNYRLFMITDRGLVEHPHFVGDPTYRFRDYFLQPRSAS